MKIIINIITGNRPKKYKYNLFCEKNDDGGLKGSGLAAETYLL